jgi:hypothetical protein
MQRECVCEVYNTVFWRWWSTFDQRVLTRAEPESASVACVADTNMEKGTWSMDANGKGQATGVSSCYHARPAHVPWAFDCNCDVQKAYYNFSCRVVTKYAQKFFICHFGNGCVGFEVQKIMLDLVSTATHKYFTSIRPSFNSRTEWIDWYAAAGTNTAPYIWPPEKHNLLTPYNLPSIENI